MAPPRTRPRRLLAVLGAMLFALLALAPVAGANVISPEPSHSPNADDITTLYWIGLSVAVALIVAVNVALILAVVRYRERRGREPRQLRGTRRVQVRAAGGLFVIAAAVFVASVIYTDKARDVAPSGPEGLQASSATLAQRSLKALPEDEKPLEIDATAQQWLWRFGYPNGAFSYYKLVVPVDTAVRLDLLTTDVVHTWYVPELGGKFDAVPGKLNQAWFRADRTGSFFGRSATFSGASYSAERIEVKVVTPDEYTAYTEQQKRDIQAAQDTVVKQIQSGKVP